MNVGGDEEWSCVNRVRRTGGLCRSGDAHGDAAGAVREWNAAAIALGRRAGISALFAGSATGDRRAAEVAVFASDQFGVRDDSCIAAG